MPAAVAAARRLKEIGRAKPRIAPPLPARSNVQAFTDGARELGIELYPWQQSAARYLTALGQGDRWLYPEVAVIVGRQNGKTTLLVPLIVQRLRAGRRVTHMAQNRELPREVFGRIATIFSTSPGELASKNGRTVWPRFANGQEEIRLANGGVYRIVAGNRGGARGLQNDDVIVDELREMKDHGIVADVGPTLLASDNPQMIYLSNMGEEDSVVLNAIRDRADQDPSLAYLEWSAAPDRSADDRAGWLEANPSAGHKRGVMEYLERKYESHRLGGTLDIFETEHLCRKVASIRQRLVDSFSWSRCQAESLGQPHRPVMAVSLDPEGRRASAAIAWPQADDTLALQLLFDVPGNPIDVGRLGRDLRGKANELGVTTVGFDPLTDAALAPYFRKSEPITGQKWANASSRFVAAVESNKLRWTDAGAVGDDLTWTARKDHDESGSFQAVRANDDRPITAVLAAVRAVWLASAPRPKGVERRSPGSVGF